MKIWYWYKQNQVGIGTDQYQVPGIGIGIDQYQFLGIVFDQKQVFGVLYRLRLL